MRGTEHDFLFSFSENVLYCKHIALFGDFLMKHRVQTSESFLIGAVLALSGGFMDAYSYLCRGEVFANAQTGNLLLLGVSLASGQWATALHYVCPIAAFVVGIALSDILRRHVAPKTQLHWRQYSLLLEILCLFCVCFISQKYNTAANSLTSLACGIQVESFRKIHGNQIATTMCIGNLRSATQNIGDYLAAKDKSALRRGLLYYAVILCFVCGAVLGNLCIGFLAERALLVCCVLLLAAFCIMFIRTVKEQKTERKSL